MDLVSIAAGIALGVAGTLVISRVLPDDTDYYGSLRETARGVDWETAFWRNRESVADASRPVCKCGEPMHCEMPVRYGVESWYCPKATEHDPLDHSLLTRVKAHPIGKSGA